MAKRFYKVERVGGSCVVFTSNKTQGPWFQYDQHPTRKAAQEQIRRAKMDDEANA